MHEGVKHQLLLWQDYMINLLTHYYLACRDLGST